MQDRVNKMIRTARDLQLFMVHYGVYDSQLENYNNIPALISKTISSLTDQMNLLPSFQDNPQEFKYNDNICGLLGSGLYDRVTYSFSNRNDINFCNSLQGGVLTQGFKATITRYILAANQLYTNSPQTFNYNTTQRETYLNDNFFSTTVQLLDYLTLHLDWMLIEMNDTLVSKQSLYLKVWTILWSILIPLVILLYVFAGDSLLQQLRKDIRILSSCYMLISSKSIIENRKLKDYFLEHKQKFKAIK